MEWKNRRCRQKATSPVKWAFGARIRPAWRSTPFQSQSIRVGKIVRLADSHPTTCHVNAVVDRERNGTDRLAVQFTFVLECDFGNRHDFTKKRLSLIIRKWNEPKDNL